MEVPFPMRIFFVSTRSKKNLYSILTNYDNSTVILTLLPGESFGYGPDISKDLQKVKRYDKLMGIVIDNNPKCGHFV